jgi:hypothetical protein
MLDFQAAKILGHRRNLDRYHWLLSTELTEHERQYIQRRIAEERAELERLELSAEQQDSPASPNAAIEMSAALREATGVEPPAS